MKNTYIGHFVFSIWTNFSTPNGTGIGLIKCDGESSFKRKSNQLSAKNSLKKLENEMEIILELR